MLKKIFPKKCFYWGQSTIYVSFSLPLPFLCNDIAVMLFPIRWMHYETGSEGGVTQSSGSDLKYFRARQDSKGLVTPLTVSL